MMRDKYMVETGKPQYNVPTFLLMSDRERTQEPLKDLNGDG
jgi:hypothetical protein